MVVGAIRSGAVGISAISPHYHQTLRRPPHLHRRLSGLIACILAAAASPATPTPSLAAPIDYVLSNVTATFPNGKDTITGNFTFDPTTDTIDQVDITVVGPIFPGRYNRAPVATPLSITASEEARRITTGVLGSTTAVVITIAFRAALGDISDPVTHVDIESHVTDTVTGEATPGR
jgi:hypothetical protein